MEVLKAYLTPKAKKQRLTEEEDDMKIQEEEDEDRGEEDTEEPPAWAQQMQRTILKEMTSMIRPLTTGMEDFRTEVNSIKLHMGMVQAEAEEATTQAGLAHSAAEEAVKLTQDLDEKVKKIEASMVTMSQVQNINEMFKTAGEAKPLNKNVVHNSTAGDAESEKTEQFKRTAFIGGFEEDSIKADVVHKVKDILKDVGGVEDVFAYRRGSIGFARFQSIGAMYKFLEQYNWKDGVKPTHNGKTLWATASRSPSDRRKRRILVTYKNVIVDAGLADASQIDFDVRRGILWMERTRVGEWAGDADTGRLLLSGEKVKQAGMKVEPKMIDDAVNEVLSFK